MLAHLDPNTQKVQKNAIYWTKTNNPLYQATNWFIGGGGGGGGGG